MPAGRRGQGLVEYALLLAFAVVVLVSAVMVFAQRTNDLLTNASASVGNAV